MNIYQAKRMNELLERIAVALERFESRHLIGQTS